MDDYIGIAILLVALAIAIYLAKKDKKEWYNSDGVQKSFIIRAIILISFLIVLLTLKIINFK